MLLTSDYQVKKHREYDWISKGSHLLLFNFSSLTQLN